MKNIVLGAALTVLPLSALAESVTLRAANGRLEITGEFRGFDGETWIVRTPVGEMRIPAEGMTCIAGACPPEATASAAPEGTTTAPAQTVAPGVETAATATAQTPPATNPPSETVAATPPDALPETATSTAPVVAATAGPAAPAGEGASATESAAAIAASITPERDFDESRIRLAGQPELIRNLAPLMVETWGFLDQRDFSQRGSSDSRVLLLSGGGRDPLDIELMASSQTDIAELMSQGFVDVALAGEEALLDIPGADYSVIGLDAAAFITTRDNQINALNMSDLADILSGRISNWSALGGPDMPIRLMLPGDTNSTAWVIANGILRDAGLQMAANVQRVESESLLADAVARERGAIGLVGFAEVRNAKPLAIADSCGLRTAPEEFAIKAGDYPLVRRILAIYPASGVSNSTTRLLDFMTGTMAERTLVNVGLVALSPATANVSEQGLRFAQVTLDPSTRGSEDQLINFTQTLIDARRLSLTLRAGGGETGLDSRGEDDLRRLAELIRANRFSGQEILLVGFTDSARSSANSVALANERSQTVADALAAQLVNLPANVAVTPIGYGHVAPLACNADPRGALVNNRIEVWARALR
ncbi:MAG: substrate-binding domain-containing protein [Paracoccaceae bacterium]